MASYSSSGTTGGFTSNNRRVNLGPFSHHAYLAFTVKTSMSVDSIDALRRNLEYNHGIYCLQRCENPAATASVQSAINAGITRCKKVIVIVTDEYEDDDWSKLEMKKIVEKSTRFSRDVVIVLRDENMQKQLPQSLQGFYCRSVSQQLIPSTEFAESLAKDIAREPNCVLATMPKENIGYGSAIGYFYGYLRLVLPEFRKRLVTQTLANDKDMAALTVRKMLIIMPESCFCPPSIEKEGRIEHTNKFVVCTAHRAGNKNRDYKSSLYKIFDKDKKCYYFVGELATPLLTMYESYYFGVTQMTRDELYYERNAFYVSLKAMLDHPDNKNCNDEFELLFWHSDPDNPTENKTGAVELYDYLLPIVRRLIDAQNSNENFGSEKPTVDAGRRLVTDGGDVEDLLETFKSVDVRGTHPGAIYDMCNEYPLSKTPRGICLVINNNTFDKGGHERLDPRRGSTRDISMITELFTRLNFVVQVHEDLQLSALERLLLTTSLMDHKNYAAFACVIMTHGRLGQLYTSDAQAVRILDIVDYFRDQLCPSLMGKPKMFFIQACQKGTESQNHGNQAGRVQRDDVQVVEAAEQTPLDNAVTSNQVGGVLGGDVQVIEAAKQNPLDNTETGNQVGRVQGGDVQVIEAATNPLDNTETSAKVSTFETRLMCDSFESDAGFAPTLTSAEPVNQNRAELVPSFPDFLLSYATLPGAVAYRDIEVGSLYIEQLWKHLGRGQEIDRELKLVTQDVKAELQRHKPELLGNVSRSQIPFYVSTGDKLIHL